MKPRGSIFVPQMVPKWLLEASGALLGANWAPGGSPRGSKNASGGPLGRKKIHCYLRGGLRKKSQRNFTLPGGPGERFGPHFGNPWGSFWPSVWRSVLKMRECQFLQTVHTKTLIVRLPGASRSAFLDPKTVPKTVWKPRARARTFQDPKNRFPSALGGLPGSKKIGTSGG